MCALLGASVPACGKIKTVDPADPDADPNQTDAGEDLTPGEVTVTAYWQFQGEKSFGDPLTDTPVLFFGPDGVFIEEATTDDEGVATGVVPPDSTVVVAALTPQGEAIALATFGVQPGDEIAFAAPEPFVESGGPVIGMMTIEVPALGKEVSYYEVYTGCTSKTGSNVITEVPFHEECIIDGDVDVLVRAFDVNNEPIEITSKRQAFTDTGTISIASWKGNDDLEIAMTDVPAELRRASFNLTPAHGLRRFGSLSPPSLEMDGDAALSLAKLDTFGDRLTVSAQWQPNQQSLGSQTAIHVLEPDASDLPLALEEELLPWIGPRAYAEADRTWTWARTSGRSPDAQYLFFFGTRKDPAEQFGWVAVVPGDWTSATLPDIPDEYAAYRFEDYAGIEGDIVMAVETSEYDGYDIRRVGLLPFWASFGGSPQGLEIGSSWRMSFGGNL